VELKESKGFSEEGEKGLSSQYEGGNSRVRGLGQVGGDSRGSQRNTLSKRGVKDKKGDRVW